MPINYKKYPSNWKSEIVPRITIRSGNRCEKCGLQNGSYAYSIRLWVRDHTGRYKPRKIWFRSKKDAQREAGDGRVWPVRIVLTVAHLDHDEENHEVSDDRLSHLCQICHLRYDAKEKYRRALLR